MYESILKDIFHLMELKSCLLLLLCYFIFITCFNSAEKSSRAAQRQSLADPLGDDEVEADENKRSIVAVHQIERMWKKLCIQNQQKSSDIENRIEINTQQYCREKKSEIKLN